MTSSALRHISGWGMGRGSPTGLCGQLKEGKDAAYPSRRPCGYTYITLTSPVLMSRPCQGCKATMVSRWYGGRQVKWNLKYQVEEKQALESPSQGWVYGREAAREGMSLSQVTKHVPLAPWNSLPKHRFKGNL